MDAVATDNAQSLNSNSSSSSNNNIIKNEEKKEEKVLLFPTQEQLLEQTVNEALAATSVSNGKGINRKVALNSTEDRSKCDLDNEITELLGSVTTQNCPGTRTSARVIQKMKQDQSRPMTPPQLCESKKDEKIMQKTPSQLRATKPIWTNLERNLFFDALNDYGKNFEAIGNFINSKLKRKSQTDQSFKTKEQVRQHYYQTFHKISKYVKFSDEIKKLATELYTLINYGEMRRRVHFVTDKHFMKLKHLVYQGQVVVRCKGKNIRLKTPSCKALRRLNLLDDSLEDIRLPSKIEVLISPANMTSYCRVQTIAQNPRVRIIVPLHKKLLNLIKTFEFKWRSTETRLSEEAAKMFPTTSTSADTDGCSNSCVKDADMCFLPKPNVTIHRPLLSITEYLSSGNICLSAYEQRMGVKMRCDTATAERQGKRQRFDSGSEKRSPDSKKCKANYFPIDKPDTNMLTEERKEDTEAPAASSGDELSDEIVDLLSDVEFQAREDNGLMDAAKTQDLADAAAEISTAARAARRGNTQQRNARTSNSFKPLINDEVMQRIRHGWTVANAADTTIGDLYVVFGQDSTLELEYYWTNAQPPAHLAAENCLKEQPTLSAESIFAQKQAGMPYNPSECENPQLLKSLAVSTLGNRLRHLLLIASLSERIRKRQCSCGHICDRNTNKNRLEFVNKTFVTHRTVAPNLTETSGIFRQPTAPMRRPIFNTNTSKELSALPHTKMPRQMLVQQLMLPASANRVNGKCLVEKNETATVSLAQTTSKNDIDTTNAVESTISANTVNTVSVTDATDSAKDSNSNKSSSDALTNSNTTATAAESKTETVDKTTNSTDSQQPRINCFINALDNLEFPPSPARNVSKDVGLCTPVHNPDTPDSAFDEGSNISLFNSGLLSPINLLQSSSSNSRWLNENLHDFSLTSLLGHLDGISGTNDILDPSSNLSVISESSVDYSHKFQEINALIQSQENNTD